MHCTAAQTGRMLARFMRDEQGAELVEWVLLTVVVGLAGYAALAGARTQASRLFDRAMEGLMDYLSN